MHSSLEMIESASLIWDNCLSFIKDNINQQAYKTWFAPVKPVKLSGASLTVQVPSKFFYEWLEEHYIELLSTALTKQLGEDARLVYDVKMENNFSSNKSRTLKIPSAHKKFISAQNSSAPIEQKNREVKNPFVIPGLRRVEIESRLNSNYNFNSFIEGDSNRLGRAAGHAVALKPGKTSFNPLLVHGCVGLGKTHLVHAIGIEIKEKYPEKSVLYISSEEFTQQYIDAVKKNNRTDFIHFYQMIDVLIVDDIQFLSGKKGTQDVFFHIFNHLHQNGKQVILTSDKAPVDMQDIEQRLLSRFKWGLSAELHPPNYQTRLTILKSRLFRDGVEMPDEITEHIAKYIDSNIRELEGVFTSLIAHAAFNREEFSLSLAKQIVDKFVKSNRPEISIEHIQKVVAKYFDIDVATLQSKSRKRNIVQARQLAMYFSKKMTRSSLENIGFKTGKRDHSTVMHACKTVENLSETDKEFNSYIEELKKQLI